MQFIIFTEQNKQSYQHFVTNHPRGSFVQSWDWGDWQHALGKQVERVGILDTTTNELLLTAQVLLPTTPVIHKRYIHIPYGPLLAPDLATEDQALAAHALLTELRQRHTEALCIRLEPRMHVTVAAATKKSINTLPQTTLLIDLQQSEEQLLAAMHPKTRYNIKAATRYGVTVSTVADVPEQVPVMNAAIELILSTGKRHEFKSHGREYYENMIAFFSKQWQRTIEAIVYQAQHNGQVVASAIVIDYAGTRTHLFSGSKKLEKQVMAPYGLRWQSMLDAKAKGLTSYDFWGLETAGGKQPGFVQFKRGFGGSEAHFPGACDIVIKPLWYTVYSLARHINRKLS
jgi:peptidoglycan pentaglycine glycine transferase (the first glycine)